MRCSRVLLVQLRVLLMPKLYEQACYYLLLICLTVQVADKTFQLLCRSLLNVAACVLHVSEL